MISAQPSSSNGTANTNGKPGVPSSHQALAAVQSKIAVRKDQVTELVGEVGQALHEAVREIHDINADTKVLALNARIEAARAGKNGAAFSVVAAEMQKLSETTSHVADAMAHKTAQKIDQLLAHIGTHIRGTRLSDLALTNIDLIDRCLYERTCDVRWWATDSSVTQALSERTPAAFQNASQRMGVILNAYTVYFDLVLCDESGRVVANGRPELFHSVGRDEQRAPWFVEAMSTRTGDEFGFQTAHVSTLVNHQPVLIYSASVREGGNSTGRKLGALGVVFNWAGLFSPIFDKIPLPSEEKGNTEMVIVDSDRRILASSKSFAPDERLHLDDFDKVLSSKKGHFIGRYRSEDCCIAHAKAPGFETYSTGWYSLIIQPLA